MAPTDKRLGLRGRQQGSAGLDAGLGAEQPAQGLLRGGRVGAPAQGGPEFIRRGRVVLALAGGARQGTDDRILGADAGMDGIARGRGEALGNEVGLGGGEVLLGRPEEALCALTTRVVAHGLVYAMRTPVAGQPCPRA
jgi:hypothetical protein